MGLALGMEKMRCMLTDLEGIMAYFIFLRAARSLPAMKRLLSAGFPTSGQIRPPGAEQGPGFPRRGRRLHSRACTVPARTPRALPRAALSLANPRRGCCDA